ncbi:hypothetical protein DAKH74_034530 [Maudiozyma humilis]|uniref:RFX-type winged-helix domain-containing protein n=1 Tax=Maudiozyma humilis TaxID=51915 RepID=A0AAV5RZR2_MAUHU|nr:hypothetical protein DAKH74_034530 [Kazachstania humilis]
MESTPTVNDSRYNAGKGQPQNFQFNGQRTLSTGPTFSNEFHPGSNANNSYLGSNSQYNSPPLNSARAPGSNGSSTTNGNGISNYDKPSRPNVTNYLSQPKIADQSSLHVLSLPQPYRQTVGSNDSAVSAGTVTTNAAQSNNYYHYSASPTTASVSAVSGGVTTPATEMAGYPVTSPYHDANAAVQDRQFSNGYIPQSLTHESKPAFVAQYSAAQPYVARNSFPQMWMRMPGGAGVVPGTPGATSIASPYDQAMKQKQGISLSPPLVYKHDTPLHIQYMADQNGGSIIRRNTQEQIAKTIAEKNVDVPIEEYAENVRKAELAVLNMNTHTHSKSSIQRAEQNREREKHVYALLWLMKNCKAEPNSYVPRSRIFSQYAASCAQCTLKPLSQATLGKLIRTIFPEITTRRLGMRGQSKYHYCNLVLLPECNGSSRSSSNGLGITGGSGDATTDGSSPNSISNAASGLSNGDNNLAVNENGNNSAQATVATLFNEVFKCKELDFDNTLRLPPIPSDDIPSSVDSDIASSLESLYHVHCLSIYESIFFGRFEDLPNSLNLSSNGSLSPQMFNLLISSELYNWVYECDLKTHAIIIQELAKKLVNDEKIDEVLLQDLEKFACSYKDIVSKASLDLPIPMVENKVAVATKFCLVLKELLKLLNFSKAFITNFPDSKNGMVSDWASLVDEENLTDSSEVDEKIASSGEDTRAKMCQMIAHFLESTETDTIHLKSLIEQFCNFIAHESSTVAHNISNYYLRFFSGLIGELSLKSSKNLSCWLYFNNIICQLLAYSSDFRNFIDLVK